MDGWLNIYKPLGVSSAKVVAIIKRSFSKYKIGHCGTLDVEAEGILPIAIGEATKLTRILVDAKKTYIFTIQFGAKTNTGDRVGQVIETTDNFPTESQCYDVCAKFLGSITQTPPKFSALKIQGVRAYKLARLDEDFELQPRIIRIYSLQCFSVNSAAHTATYSVECSKGTYVRSLAEDIALSLQSFGFVLELRRICVGMFALETSVKVTDEMDAIYCQKLSEQILPIETVLDDILVLDATEEEAQKIRYGVEYQTMNYLDDCDLCWVRYQGKLLAIGSINNSCFKSLRVFNT